MQAETWSRDSRIIFALKQDPRDGSMKPTLRINGYSVEAVSLTSKLPCLCMSYLTFVESHPGQYDTRRTLSLSDVGHLTKEEFHKTQIRIRRPERGRVSRWRRYPRWTKENKSDDEIRNAHGLKTSVGYGYISYV